MPTSMKYKWLKNKIEKDDLTGLSSYGEPETVSTPCQLYSFGNVDAFGAMALIYIPTEIVNQTIEEKIIDTGRKDLSGAIIYGKQQEIAEHRLSGWHSCSNRYLEP